MHADKIVDGCMINIHVGRNSLNEPEIVFRQNLPFNLFRNLPSRRDKRNQPGAERAGEPAC